MAYFEVGHFGRVSSLDQGLESRLYEAGGPSAQHGLLAEQVCECLVVESGLEDAGAGGSEPLCKCKGDLLGVAGIVLVDANEGRNSESLDEHIPFFVPGGLGSHHYDVDVFRRNDGLVGHSETVGELKCAALPDVGLDEFFVYLWLDLVGQKHHDDVRGLGGLGEIYDLEAVLFRFVP